MIDVHQRDQPDLGGRPIELVAIDFDGFFTAQYPGIVRLLTARTGSRHLAEELAQEAFLRAHRRWRRVSAYDAPGAWVRRVALNLASNSWSRRRNEHRMVERLGREPEPSLGLRPEDEEFWDVVRSLPERQGTAVTLHYLEDRSVAEVARIMGCALGTAKAHLHKGRTRLALLLDHPDGEPR